MGYLAQGGQACQMALDVGQSVQAVAPQAAQHVCVRRQAGQAHDFAVARRQAGQSVHLATLIGIL